MQDVLAYQRTTGMTDVDGNAHKVIAYAALRNPTDIGLLAPGPQDLRVRIFGH